MAFVHAFQSWYYLGGPLLLYAVDKSTRLLNSSRMHPIIGIKYHPQAKVITLCVSSTAISGRGGHLAGQFCWVNIPAISPFEWHPFSIVSPPFLAQQRSATENGHAKQQQHQQHQHQHHSAGEGGEDSGHIAFAIKVMGNNDYGHDCGHDDDYDNDDDDNKEPRSWTSQLAGLAWKRERRALAQAAAVRAARGAENNVGVSYLPCPTLLPRISPINIAPYISMISP